MQINLALICLANSQRGSGKEMENTNDKLFKGKFWNWQSCKNDILWWFRYIMFCKMFRGGKKDQTIAF